MATTDTREAKRFHIEYRGIAYDKGWPKTNSKPFLVYRDGKFYAGYPTRAAASSAIKRLLEARS